MSCVHGSCTRVQLKCDSDDDESDDDGESGDDDENDCDGESGGNEDESEEEKSDDSEDDDDGCGDSDENVEESEDSEEDDDVSVLVNWIQNSNTTIRMLKEKCRSVGLKMNGRKHEVVERLLDHFS